MPRDCTMYRTTANSNLCLSHHNHDWRIKINDPRRYNNGNINYNVGGWLYVVGLIGCVSQRYVTFNLIHITPNMLYMSKAVNFDIRQRIT